MVGTTPRIGLLRHGKKWRSSIRMLPVVPMLNADALSDIDLGELQLWPTYVSPNPEIIELVEHARRQIMEICGIRPLIKALNPKPVGGFKWQTFCALQGLDPDTRSPNPNVFVTNYATWLRIYASSIGGEIQW